MRSSIKLPRVSVALLVGILIVGTSLTLGVNGKPSPNDTLQDAKATASSAGDTINDFVDRAKNTFTGKSGEEHKKLSTLEIVAVVAGAVLLFMIVFCCIGYCLCECVKELICCICCCGCCRD